MSTKRHDVAEYEKKLAGLPNFFATPLREMRAPWWKMLAARLFGRRIVSVDWPTGATMIAYLWREKLYVAKLKS